MPDVMYPAPAGERWVMDIDYSEQQATEDAINASYSYCYFQNI
jgi:hypothetical protein